MADDAFTLYDLRVECVEIRGEPVASYEVGDSFEVRGEELRFPEGQGFSMYALSALLPLLPAKQRETADSDWMTTDTRVQGPDPNVDAVFRIERVGERTFRHDEVSGEPLPAGDGAFDGRDADGEAGDGAAAGGEDDEATVDREEGEAADGGGDDA